jgi:hypothetical protein
MPDFDIARTPAFIAFMAFIVFGSIVKEVLKLQRKIVIPRSTTTVNVSWAEIVTDTEVASEFTL